jgi:hypothetical protein
MHPSDACRLPNKRDKKKNNNDEKELSKKTNL